MKWTTSQKSSITRWFHIQKPNSPNVIKIVLEHRKWGKPPNSFHEGNKMLSPKSDKTKYKKIENYKPVIPKKYQYENIR